MYVCFYGQERIKELLYQKVLYLLH
jgi:hypothetical protein